MAELPRRRALTHVRRLAAALALLCAGAQLPARAVTLVEGDLIVSDIGRDALYLLDPACVDPNPCDVLTEISIGGALLSPRTGKEIPPLRASHSSSPIWPAGPIAWA